MAYQSENLDLLNTLADEEQQKRREEEEKQRLADAEQEGLVNAGQEAGPPNPATPEGKEVLDSMQEAPAPKPVEEPVNEVQNEQQRKTETREAAKARLNEKKDSGEALTPEESVQWAYLNSPAVTQAGAEMGIGLGDFLFDAGAAFLGMKDQQEWWNEFSNREGTNEGAGERSWFMGAARQFGAIGLPSLAAGGVAGRATAGSINSVNQASLLTTGYGLAPKTANLLAKGAGFTSALGAELTVSGISEYTSQPGNIFNVTDMVGLKTPLGSYDYDDPNHIWWKNQFADVLVSTLPIIGDVAAAARGGNTYVPKTPQSKAAFAKREVKIQEQANKFAEGNVPAGRALATRANREADSLEEARQILKNDPEGVQGYNPMVNEPAEKVQRTVHNTEAEVDPIEFKADVARKHYEKNGGGVRPAATSGMIKDLNAAKNNKERAKILRQIHKDQGVSFDMIVNRQDASAVRYSAKEIDEAMHDVIREMVDDPNYDYYKAQDAFDQFMEETSIVKRGTDEVIKVSRLSDAGNKAAMKIIGEFMDLADPAILKGSTVAAKQAAEELSGLSFTAATFEEVDTKRLIELMRPAIETLFGEVRASKYIKGYQLKSEDNFFGQLVKKLTGKGKRKSKIDKIDIGFMTDANEEFLVNVKKRRKEGLEFVNTMLRISEENPNYFRPMYYLFAKTDGKIKTQEQMLEYFRRRINFTSGFFNTNPKISSIMFKEAESYTYNNILFGRAPLNAATGAALNLLTDPISNLIGAAKSGDAMQMRGMVASYFAFWDASTKAMGYAVEQMKLAHRYPNHIKDVQSGGILGLSEEMEDLYTVEMPLIDEALDKMNVNEKLGFMVTKAVHWLGQNKLARAGSNALFGVDMFYSSFKLSQVTRFQAYMKAVELDGGVPNNSTYEALSQAFYNLGIDDNGMITDQLTRALSQDANLNAKNPLANQLNNQLSVIPPLKLMVKFIPTQLNAINRTLTFLPTGTKLQAEKVKNLFVAKKGSVDQKLDSLEGFGIDPSKRTLEVYNQLLMDYEGRQVVGGLMLGSAMAYAWFGNITGPGPRDQAKLRRMVNQGFKPLHIKNPITGTEHDYSNIPVLSTLLSLVGGTAFELQRVDEGWAENAAQDLLYMITASFNTNELSKSFEAISRLVTGTSSDAEYSRLIAGLIDQFAPFAGVRSALGSGMEPNLKDFERNVNGYLDNRNKFAVELPDVISPYTGKGTSEQSGWNAFVSTIVPFGRSSSGHEDWQKFMVYAQPKGFSQMYIYNGVPIPPEGRQQINKIIADRDRNSKGENRLVREIKKLEKSSRAKRDLAEIKKLRGMFGNDNFDTNNYFVYKEFDRIHKEEFDYALRAWLSQNNEIAQQVVQAAANKYKLKLQTEGNAPTSQKQITLEQLNEIN